MKKMLKEIAAILKKYDATIEVDNGHIIGTIDICSNIAPWYVEFGGYIDAEIMEKKIADLSSSG